MSGKAFDDEKVKQKLESNRYIDPKTGCWIWLGSTNNGYGMTCYKAKMVKVHRLSLHLYKGFDLDSDLNVNHIRECKRRSCFNPEHLYDGTQQDNMHDYSKLTTHCPYGHEYTKENTYIDDPILRTKRCRKCRDNRKESKLNLKGEQECQGSR